MPTYQITYPSKPKTSKTLTAGLFQAILPIYFRVKNAFFSTSQNPWTCSQTYGTSSQNPETCSANLKIKFSIVQAICPATGKGAPGLCTRFPKFGTVLQGTKKRFLPVLKTFLQVFGKCLQVLGTSTVVWGTHFFMAKRWPHRLKI